MDQTDKKKDQIEVSIKEIIESYGINKGCRKCNGTGSIGRYAKGRIEICPCLTKRVKKEGDELYYGGGTEAFLLEVK